MEPVLIASVLEPAVAAAAKILSKRNRRQLAEEALEISEREPESQTRLRLLFDHTKKRLATTWKIGISMTITLFVLFVGMAIAAVVSAIVLGNPVASFGFGGVSLTSLITVIVWKPFQKTFEASTITQRLETIAIGLEQEWAACSAIEDPEVRVRRIREANQAALREIAKMSP